MDVHQGSTREESSINNKSNRGSHDRNIRRGFAERLEARRLLSTVTVNTANIHQTIIGIGGDYALGAITGPYTGIAQDAVGEATLQYLSPTEARVGLPLAQWAPTNDQGQGSPTWSGYQDNGLVHNVFFL
ncbi:MAG: hypothetical protein JO353_13730, partial [Phycisphaerae bacterium]|nr:hypothetical protein [Phycisphaerae bacterium]